MLCESAKIVDAGIDYFTTTATVPSEARLMMVQADTLLSRERRLGFDVKPWTMSGYHGWLCGRLQFGERSDGCIVRLSSGLAAQDWFTFYQTSGRCSRVDFQVTLYCDGPVPAEVFAIAAMAKTFYGERKDGPRITLWSDNEGGATCYLGKRKSSLFFRGYNKEAQSNLPEWSKCLRLELEVKGRLTSWHLAKAMAAESVKLGCILIISDYLRDRGIAPNLFQEYPRSFYERWMPATDRLNSLEWLARQVAPVVHRLIDDGLGDAALEILGLSKIAMRSRGES